MNDPKNLCLLCRISFWKHAKDINKTRTATKKKGENAVATRPPLHAVGGHQQAKSEQIEIVANY